MQPKETRREEGGERKFNLKRLEAGKITVGTVCYRLERLPLADGEATLMRRVVVTHDLDGTYITSSEELARRGLPPHVEEIDGRGLQAEAFNDLYTIID